MPSLVCCFVYCRFKFRATTTNGQYTDSEYSEQIKTGITVLQIPFQWMTLYEATLKSGNLHGKALFPFLINVIHCVYSSLLWKFSNAQYYCTFN